MNHGFVKVAAAVPEVQVAHPRSNLQSIESLVIQAEGHGVEVITLPELCLTGYTCGDLFHQQLLLDEAEMALIQLMNFTRSLDIITIVGLPVAFNGALYNCAAVIQKGKILGLVPKTYIPNYSEFYERRWFASAADLPAEAFVWLCGQQVQLSARLLFHTSYCVFGIELCEDLWAPIPPSSNLALAGADIIFNLSASNDVVGKRAYLMQLLCQQSARCLCGYVYVAAGFGESTQDTVFSGKAMILENGTLLAEAKPHSLQPQLIESEIDVERIRAERRLKTTFAACGAHMAVTSTASAFVTVDTALLTPRELELTRPVAPHPFVPAGRDLDARCEEIFAIQTEGLAKRLRHTGSQTAVIGISGGLDSTLALLVCVRAFDLLGIDRQGIVGVTMPGFGTTDRTYENALSLIEKLSVTGREISIKDSVTQHFMDIGHDIENHDVTYENAQARERTQILMDIANDTGGLVVGTGDLSELALGWATYNGDHISMYGVNASVPKTLVRYLVGYYADTCGDEELKSVLYDVLDTPVSPELLPPQEDGTIAQKTEDLVGPYELHDFFLYHVMRMGEDRDKIYRLARIAFSDEYDGATIDRWLTIFYKRFFASQYKRSCLPDGPKVGTVALSPRGDWRMPSDAAYTDFT